MQRDVEENLHGLKFQAWDHSCMSSNDCLDNPKIPIVWCLMSPFVFSDHRDFDWVHQQCIRPRSLLQSEWEEEVEKNWDTAVKNTPIAQWSWRYHPLTTSHQWGNADCKVQTQCLWAHWMANIVFPWQVQCIDAEENQEFCWDMKEADVSVEQQLNGC